MASQFREISLRNLCLAFIQLNFNFPQRVRSLIGKSSAYYARVRPVYATTSKLGEISTTYGVCKGRNISLREGGFSYHEIRVRVQWNSSTVIRVWKQRTDEHRTVKKTNIGRWKVTSACEKRPTGGEESYSFIQVVGNTLIYSYRCTNVGFVNSSTSAAPWILCKGVFMHHPLTTNHRRQRLYWAHEDRVRQADWHQVDFSDELRFKLWNYYGRIRVILYAGVRCL
ncbi:uncharacterized protein TNCV_4778251 [Trichonephila clavipes]|nr:uncharacterized protein TNCV_4778251 [Trichonephila clavipes]